MNERLFDYKLRSAYLKECENRKPRLFCIVVRLGTIFDDAIDTGGKKARCGIVNLHSDSAQVLPRHVDARYQKSWTSAHTGFLWVFATFHATASGLCIKKELIACSVALEGFPSGFAELIQAKRCLTSCLFTSRAFSTSRSSLSRPRPIH